MSENVSGATVDEATGTATITLPGKVVHDESGAVVSQGAAQTVQLPQASLDQVLTFWEQWDILTSDASSGKIKGAEVLRAYANWVREILFTIGSPQVYRKETTDDSTVQFVLTREDLIEPAWFMSPGFIRDLLAHWQSNPLDRSSDLVPTLTPIAAG